MKWVLSLLFLRGGPWISAGAMEAVGAGSSDTVSSGDIITGAIIILVGGCMQGATLSLPSFRRIFARAGMRIRIYCRTMNPTANTTANS